MKRGAKEDAAEMIATSSDVNGEMLLNERAGRTTADNCQEKTNRSGDEAKGGMKKDASDEEDDSHLAAASSPTRGEWIQHIMRSNISDSVCDEIMGTLEKSRDLTFLGTRFVCQEDPIKGPRYLPLAFPEDFTNAAGITEDRIATDKDKRLWLRFGKANFKGTTLLEETFPDNSGQRLDLVPTLIGAYDSNKPDALQINICSYSGHGISKEDAEKLNRLGLAESIYEKQKQQYGIVEWNRLGYLSNVTRDNPSKFQFHVGDGILCPQNMPDVTIFVGIKDLSSYWLEKVAVRPNKFLVVVLDSCFSGAAAEALPAILETAADMPKSSALVIQYACRSDECAYAGYFTPTFMRLQHRETRRAMGALYEASKTQPSQLWDDIMVEGPQQHIGLFVSSNCDDPPGFRNESTHPNLYFENAEWPIPLIKDANFFDFCFRVFQYDTNFFDAGEERSKKKRKSFPPAPFQQLETLLSKSRYPDAAQENFGDSDDVGAQSDEPQVEIFNYWLKKYAKDQTKLAIIPFRFPMQNGSMVHASAHYHHNKEDKVTCVNYFLCKQSKKENDKRWFDKRIEGEYSQRKGLDEANGKIEGPHHVLYAMSQNYVAKQTCAKQVCTWSDSEWNMTEAYDPSSYCFKGTNTIYKRGDFENLVLAKILDEWAPSSN